jgi:hypothetical protein
MAARNIACRTADPDRKLAELRARIEPLGMMLFESPAETDFGVYTADLRRGVIV